MWRARLPGLFVVAIQLCMAGCTTAPFGDRARIIDVPLASVQSDLEFSITSGSRADLSCADNSPCSSALEQEDVPLFVLDVGLLASVLQKSALQRYPDLAWCQPRVNGSCFDVYVVEGDEPGSSSSANGRIALTLGLGRWRGHDGVLAFVIAREMGHVIARHHAERSSINLVTSVVLNLLLPGSGLLKALISTGGARLAAASNHSAQVIEADAIALGLLQGAGFRLPYIARNLRLMPVAIDQSSWAKDFAQSSTTLVSEARTAESKVAAAMNGKLNVRRGASLTDAR